tara:strand:+ start:877 stop:1812 length:936 start_codon:yes stop_codon:yes gene_type:complete
MSLTLFESRRIVLLAGGLSSERAISLQSAKTVEGALKSLAVSYELIDTGESGWWKKLRENDIAFICLHGRGGEDGVIQGFLQSLGITYTGAGVLGSALAIDKIRSKQMWGGIGLPTAPFVELTDQSSWPNLISDFGELFVKPAMGGSSIGMSKVTNADELRQAYQIASEYGKSVIAEKFIKGPEYTVAILGERTLPPIRMETDNEFYDYEAKYISDQTRYFCPCGLSLKEEKQLTDLALMAFKTLNCEVWGRVDFIRDSVGKFQLLEVNTVPGMTSHSLVPVSAKHAGISIEQLITEIVTLSLISRRYPFE